MKQAQIHGRERGGGEFEKEREVEAGSSQSLLPPSKGLN